MKNIFNKRWTDFYNQFIFLASIKIFYAQHKIYLSIKRYLFIEDTDVNINFENKAKPDDIMILLIALMRK